MMQGIDAAMRGSPGPNPRAEPSMASSKRCIDVTACLRDVNVLIGSPIRSGCRINIRLSLSPCKLSLGDGDGDSNGLVSRDHGDERDSESADQILNVTVELLLHILHYVPAESLGRLRRVCKGWKLIVDTHKEFLFKPHCLAHGFLSPLAVEIPIMSDVDGGNGGDELDQWSRIFISNYYTTKNWMSRIDVCKSPWRDDKAMPFSFDADTWGRLLEVSCEF
eukprot:m.322590 g.322590  ORF g.322590 m.322590 type:complete len:221 (+) comp27611_c0_seq5:498-1160(+)